MILAKRLCQNLYGMLRLFPSRMLDLMPATEPIRHNAVIAAHSLHRRKEPARADLQRNVIMPLFIAERAGHAAAAGIDFIYLATG